MSSAEKTKESLARDPFVGRLNDHANGRSDEGLGDWWTSFRRQQIQGLVGEALPTQKHEEWKFISLKKLSRIDYASDGDVAALVDEEVLGQRAVEEARGARLVFSNGQFMTELSDTSALGEGVEVTTISRLRQAGELDRLEAYVDIVDYWADDVFYRANGANFEDGAVILVDDGVVVETPIHVTYVGGADKAFATHPRQIVAAGQSAEVTVIEEHISSRDSAYLTNVVAEFSVGKNARIRHIKIQDQGDQSFHIARNQVTLQRDGDYEATAVNLGGELSRNDSYTLFDGTNIECTLDGLVYLTGSKVSDTHTAIDHALPDSTSYQLHKAIVDDRAHSVFNGKIFVQQDAQRIDSNQLNQNLLLSDRARVDTKPQLEIFADDVVCSHGATVGQLEDDQLFYMLARGIDPENARALLTYAFAAEILEDVTIDTLRKRLETYLMEKTH